MLDVSVAYERYKFLGYEFLTWLWYVMEEEQDFILEQDNEIVSLDMDNRIVLENSKHNTTENITIKGDDAGLEEAKLSLQKGAMVTELNFILKAGHHEWKFNIKGESLNISTLKPPETGNVEKKEDIEGAVLEKVYLYEKVVILVEKLYIQFIKLRNSNEWSKITVPKITSWIKS